MVKKFLKDVVAIAVGKQAEEIVELLDSKKYINEFVIAKKMDMTINQTRNILYKLSDHGLISFIRKKDKRKGWYTYFWKMEVSHSLEFLKETLRKKIDQIDSQIKSRETKQFYVCEKCNIEFNEENALLHDFTCSECGGVFSMKDNTKFLKELKRGREKLEKEVQLIEEELKKEMGRLGEIKEKKRKKLEKEKLIARQKKMTEKRAIEGKFKRIKKQKKKVKEKKSKKPIGGKKIKKKIKKR